MMDLTSECQANLDRRPYFVASLGIRLRSVTREEVIADLEIRPEISQDAGIAHGGALMAFADSLGGLGASVNLPPGAATITLESKTNFLAPALTGTTVTGRAERLHLGRRTTLWQTRITNAEGRLLAQITQTQMVIEPRPTAS
jgi:1,4-dihydroxy-2-naphthoyl-CoA hydrolase